MKIGSTVCFFTTELIKGSQPRVVVELDKKGTVLFFDDNVVVVKETRRSWFSSYDVIHTIPRSFTTIVNWSYPADEYEEIRRHEEILNRLTVYYKNE